MKKQHQRTLALAAALCLSLGAAVPCAAGQEAAPRVIAEATPRYTHISQISCGFSISDLGRANCSGSFTVRDGYDSYSSTATCVLQQYNGDTWEDVKTWTLDFSGSGVKMIDKGYYVGAGRYRFVVSLEIFDGNGNLKETASCTSPIKER